MESSKRKINDNYHIKTVTSKCTALSIKQCQEAGQKVILRNFIYKAVLNILMIQKLKKIP